MTAFNEVLIAEQKAEQMIAQAKKSLTTVLAGAKTEQKNRLEAEMANLNQAEATALEKHKKRTADLVSKIESDVQSEVLAVQKRFASKKSDLMTLLKKYF